MIEWATEDTAMKIENGWAFNSADFSIQAIRNCQSKGRVLFIRAHPDYSRWFEMEQESQDDDDGPPLYVAGYGMTLEEALIDANLAAAHAKPIPESRTNQCPHGLDDADCPDCAMANSASEFL